MIQGLDSVYEERSMRTRIDSRFERRGKADTENEEPRLNKAITL